MSSQIRQQQLIEILKEDPAVQVSDLATHFKVSSSTIRRDLNKLEDVGLVRRVHGGALSKTNFVTEPPFEVRKVTHQAEKSEVGKAAASIIDDGLTIFIDGGTTTPFIVPHLNGLNDLTVVTIGLNVAYKLASLQTVRIIQIGGELHRETWVYAGPLSIDRIPQKQKAIDLSRKVVVVCDGSKIGQVASARIIPMSAVDILVTDQTAPQPELDEIAKLGPEIMLANQD
jgi:DeoR/GlpR family transcriptional regulator of sugar metabolism